MNFIKKLLNLSEVFKVLNESFRGFRIKILWLALLGLFGGLLDSVGINILIPVFSFFTKSSIPGGDFISRNVSRYLSYLPFKHDLIFLVGLTICLFFFRALVLFIFSYLSSLTRINYTNETVKSLLKLVFNAKWTFLLKQRLGYIQATILKDIQSTANIMTSLGQFIISGTGLLVYLFLALNISFGITLLTLLVGSISVLILFPLVRRNRIISEKMLAIEKLVSSYLIENISGVKYVKSLTVEDEVISNGIIHYNKIKDLNMRLVIFSATLSNFMQPLALVFISGLFYYLYKLPNFNLPTFIVTVYLIQKIFTYMESTQTAFHAVNQQIPFLKNILLFKSLLEENKEEDYGKLSFKFNSTLCLKNVYFSYDADREVLSNINMNLKKGEIIGLVGPSGSGKSSVTDLLLKFLKPQKGEILLDGIDINDINTEEWRKNIGYVSQDVFLTHNSIEDNIRFYDKDISREDIQRGAMLANATEFIDKQRDGYNTLVGDRGVMLSGGQRHRIVLARILSRQPSILILDEATSALDNESELLIQEAINSLKGRMTILIIAHRLSTVMNADNLYVLDSGRIVEEGHPKNVIQNKDSYFFKTYNLKN